MKGWLVLWQSGTYTDYHGVFLNEADAQEKWEKLRGHDGPVELDDDFYIEEVTVFNKLV